MAKEVKTQAQKNVELKADYEACIAKFKGMKEAEAVKSFEEVYKVKLSKNLMAAFIKTYHAEDLSKFVAAATVKKKKYIYSVKVIDGKIIYKNKTNKATGKPIAERVKVYTGETEKKFDINVARNNFVSDYKITLKDTGFKPNKGGEAVFNPFDI